MKIITQISVFDYEEIEILGDLERCKLLIDHVPDEKIVNTLIEMRGKGRNDYPVIPVWNSILIMPLLECSTISQLRRELSRNRDLRKLCGFNDSDYYFGKCALVPPAKAYTNMIKNLVKIEPMLKECFYELREFRYKNLKDFGKESVETGKLIVYTSADSVFQIAAHEDVVSVEELYKYCEIARAMLVGEHAVGRVIARPFKGEYPNYVRTTNRHDFALAPPEKTMLDFIKDSGKSVIAIGKISDIFAGRGVTEKILTKGNEDGINKTLEVIFENADRKDYGDYTLVSVVCEGRELPVADGSYGVLSRKVLDDLGDGIHSVTIKLI